MSGPTTMTFDSLVTDIKNFVERGNPEDVTVVRQIPRIINNAERSLADKLKIQGYRDVLVGQMTAQSPSVDKPQGWRNTISINYGYGTGFNNRRILRVRGYEYLRALYPNDTQFDEPKFYTDYDFNHWLIAPVPAENYPFEAIIYRLPDLLSEQNQTNYLTNFVPNLLLYECLVGMEPFLKNDARIAVWTGLRDEQFAAVNSQELQKIVDRALVRSTA